MRSINSISQWRSCSDDWNVSLKAVRRLFDRDISVTPDNWDNNKYGCSINWNVDSGKN